MCCRLTAMFFKSLSKRIKNGRHRWRSTSKRWPRRLRLIDILFKMTPTNRRQKSKLIAPCGMNCALCAAYQRTLRKCPGCLIDRKDKNASCVRCRIKNCPRLKGAGKRFCFECALFPCARLQHLDTRYRGKYHMSMIANLTMIDKKGMAAFLKSQEKKWTCKKCGGMICCHNGLCVNCDAEKLKKRKSNYRWGK